MQPSGSLFFEDEYGQQYRQNWETVDGVLDITTETKQPFVWGKPAQGYIRNGIVYRLGIVTVQRQIMRASEDGYQIIADGASQFEEYVQTNFPCGGGPKDPFVYHLNNALSDDIETRVTIGPHWTDPDDVEDDIVWADVEADGSMATATADTLQWIDIWE